MSMETVLRISSVLILAGLAVEIASLIWYHPLAYVLFVFVSVTLVGAGILVFLLALVLAPRSQ